MSRKKRFSIYCPLCGGGSVSRGGQDIHIDSDHITVSGSFECLYCGGVILVTGMRIEEPASRRGSLADIFTAVQEGLKSGK